MLMSLPGSSRSEASDESITHPGADAELLFSTLFPRRVERGFSTFVDPYPSRYAIVTSSGARWTSVLHTHAVLIG